MRENRLDWDYEGDQPALTQPPRPFTIELWCISFHTRKPAYLPESNPAFPYTENTDATPHTSQSRADQCFRIRRLTGFTA